MIVEKQMECRLAGETEALFVENHAPAPIFSIKKSQFTRPGLEPGPPRWETPANNRLSYGAALV
jgi:hypothetical protein